MPSRLDRYRLGLPPPEEEEELLPATTSVSRLNKYRAGGAAPISGGSVLDKYRTPGATAAPAPATGGFRFPPPPKGSIPQAEVMPEATGLEDEPLGQAAAFGKQWLRNAVGVVGGPFQNLRHPIATASIPIATNVAGTMEIAEALTPGVTDLPGHQLMNRWEDWARERIAADAPTKEIGEVASGISSHHGFRWGIPDVLSMAAPMAGLTKIPGVAPALARVTVPLGRGGARLVGAVAAPLRTALAGRRALEQTVPQVEKLRFVEYLFQHPGAAAAIPYIDDPLRAPPTVQPLMAGLVQARHDDVANWSNLTFDAREKLADLARFEQSPNPGFQLLAAEVKTKPFASQSAPSVALAKKRGFVSDIMDRYVRKSIGHVFRRPGTRSWIGARYDDPAVKDVLAKGTPRAIEAASGEQAAFASQSRDSLLSMIRQLGKDTDWDPVRLRELANEAMDFSATGRAGNLSQDAEQVITEALRARRGKLEEMAAQGLLSKDVVMRLVNNPREALLKVFEAAHDGKYLEEARTLSSWDDMRQMLQAESPNAPASQIEGAIEAVLDKDVANLFERRKFGGWQKMLGNNEVLEAVLAKPAAKGKFFATAKELYGPVKDLPTAFDVSGEISARWRGKNLLRRTVMEDWNRVGLASPVQHGGVGDPWVEVGRKHLGLSQEMWIPEALEDLVSSGEGTLKQMTLAAKALAGVGKAWRKGSTLFSPVTSAQNTMSATFSISGTGEMYRKEFVPAAVHAFKQAGSVVARGGEARGDRLAEEALNRLGLARNSVVGEIGETLKPIGGAIEMRQALPKVPFFLRSRGVDPKNKAVLKAIGFGRRTNQAARDIYEQGDIAAKRIVAELTASDFEAGFRVATPRDALMLEQRYGSANPGLIAAEMTANQMQTYSRLPQFWQNLGKNPLVGLFSAFPVESLRNFQWQGRYALKALQTAAEAESPALRKIFMERAVRQIGGMSVNLRFLSELGQITEEMAGPKLSEKQREAIRTLVVPPWDQGPLSVLERDGKNIGYAPMSNLEQYQTPRRLLEKLGELAGHVQNGRFEQIDDTAITTVTRLADEVLQFQQPIRGLLEAVMNRKFDPSPVSMAITAAKRRAVPRLSESPIPSENARERLEKGVLQGIAPTPLRQIQDIYKWGTAPPGEEMAGRSPREVSPFKYKTTDSLNAMQIYGGRVSEEKNNYSTRINKILGSKTLTPQEQADAIMDLRENWNSDFGPRLAREVNLWRSLHSRKEVLEAMSRLGEETAFAAMQGRVPKFSDVFEKTIPQQIRLRMRARKE